MDPCSSKITLDHLYPNKHKLFGQWEVTREVIGISLRGRTQTGSAGGVRNRGVKQPTTRTEKIKEPCLTSPRSQVCGKLYDFSVTASALQVTHGIRLKWGGGQAHATTEITCAVSRAEMEGWGAETGK